MNPAAYDAEARQSRSVKQAIFWLVVGIGFTYAFSMVWRLYVGPYSRFSTLRRLEHEKAIEYLTTSACTDSVKRAKLEGYNRCEEARITSEQSPAALAFHDLMDDLKFCDQGVCYLAGINVTDSFWTIARLMLMAGVLLFLLVGIGAVSFGRGGGTQLPMTMLAAANAEHMAAYLHYATSKQQQQQQQYAPPPVAAADRHKIE